MQNLPGLQLKRTFRKAAGAVGIALFILLLIQCPAPFVAPVCPVAGALLVLICDSNHPSGSSGIWRCLTSALSSCSHSHDVV